MISVLGDGDVVEVIESDRGVDGDIRGITGQLVAGKREIYRIIECQHIRSPRI